MKAKCAGPFIVGGFALLFLIVLGSCPNPPLPVSVTVDPASTSLSIGETAILTAFVEPADTDQAVLWSSGDGTIATVAVDGTVTGVAAGTTTITASSTADPSATGQCSVTVLPNGLPAVVVTIAPSSASLIVGETMSLAADVETLDANKAVVWTSSDDGIAAVDANGFVTGAAVGMATITATSVVYPSSTGSCAVAVVSNELVVGVSREGDSAANEDRWYYFNAAVACGYELVLSDVGGTPGGTSVSAYRADRSTPYFENLPQGIHAFTSEKNEAVYVRVRREGAGGAFSVRYVIDNPTPPPTWTFLMYVNGAGSLDDAVMWNVQEMIDGYHPDCGVNLVLLIDKETDYAYGVPGCDSDATRLFFINEGGIHLIAGGSRLLDAGGGQADELNMGDADILRRFIEYGKTNYPAERTALIINSHGSHARGLCDDDLSGDSLQLGEISAALDYSHSVDLIGFNCCMMGTVETAYQFRRTPGDVTRFQADVMLGAPRTVQIDGWTYDTLFERIDTERGGQTNGETDTLGGGLEAIYAPASLTALELGALIVEEQRDGMYAMGTGWGNSDCLSCFDLSFAADVKAAMDDFAVSLAAEAADGKSTLEDIRDNDAYHGYYWGNPPGTDLDKAERTLNPNYDLRDVCELAAADIRFSSGTRDAASAVCAALDDFIVCSYLGPDTTNLYGLAFFFSNGDELFNGQPMYTYQCWYNANDATGFVGWPPTATYYGKLAWCGDGATSGNGIVENWFELLDAWYDPDGNGSDGGCNGYRY